MLVLAMLFIVVNLLHKYLIPQIFVGCMFIFVMLKYYDPLEGLHERIKEFEKEGTIPL
jgi:hypothetical protein